MNRLSSKELIAFEEYLREEEKSDATVEKYLRDVRCFYAFLANRSAEKSEVLAYKEYLSQQYAPASVNSMLVALNGFLRFCGLSHCCVKLLKIQRQMFCRQEKELTREEYRRRFPSYRISCRPFAGRESGSASCNISPWRRCGTARRW